ncbi:unnamed protein product (macronuclear) [Paramecium tetraurelia]|uniref:Protein kinase domain-containing protein n=1 Tax=Paramecium tetraurelia TaxID=5888 RepID=A0CYA4_PARTE|nr:uncharacterized protein GSPATT00011371001 [Paramecium tetraurelia]CAK75771.1 unnamed protein product [Paramecium tetraurelia]|eukprot:XP_001443168.1 hypothetical protein (macronuclear) [Paramecium tetraurelia strain d4-2]
MQKNIDDEDVDPCQFIKNLDTGDTYSVNNFGELDIEIKQYKPLNQKKERWKTFWNRMEEINEKLYDACEKGEEEVVSNLLKDQIELKQQVQQQNRSYNSSLVGEDYQEFIGLINIDCKGLDDWTALHHAVNNRRVGIVKLLLDSKANPNLCTLMKRTPLHLACLRRSLEIVKLLVQYKVDLNCQDSDLNSPLHISSEIGFVQIVEFLLINGADATLKNCQQKSPYDVTMSPEVRKLLEKYVPNTEGYQSRSLIGGQVVRNSRADHIERLLGKVNELSKMEILKQQQQQQQMNQKDKQVSTPQPISQFVDVSVNASSPDGYIFHKLLGKGSFGEVYFASRKQDGEQYAIKTLCKERVLTKNLTRYAQTEKNVLSVMKHPFIVRLHAAFQNSSKLFMVLDYCPGGDLGQLLTKQVKLTEEVARFYICEVILALESLHKNCIIFRDLKPDNVVLDSKGHAKLTDFGLSKEGVYDNITKSFCGSIAYLAPEVLMKRGHSRTVDWYLVGVLLYEMIVGMPPYYNQDREMLFENIKKGVLRIPKTMSEEAKDLIRSLLVRDPSQRLGAKADAEELKKHSFFKSINWDDIYNKVQDGPFIEKDNTKQWVRETIDMKFGDQPQSNQRISDWSFIQ